MTVAPGSASRRDVSVPPKRPTPLWATTITMFWLMILDAHSRGDLSAEG